jgi:hypothetical protein
LGQTFHEQGFATAGIVSNIHLQPRFDFDDGFDSWQFNGNADAEVQINQGLKWLKKHSDQDTFLFLHLMDPHLPYKAPRDFERRFLETADKKLPEKYNRWDVNRWSSKSKITDVRKAHIEAMHDGEMAYMSDQIDRFFTELDKLPGRTVTVIHSDHGEEFWEHGGYEHNHSLYDEVTRVVLWLRPGGGLKKGLRNTVPASLMDIAPTLYAMLGFEDTPETDGRSLTQWLDGSDDGDWSRPLPVAYLQYERERWGVIWQGHKYILHTGSGREELYDLAKDGDELVDLGPKHPDLQPYRDALGLAHHLPVRHGLRIFVDMPADHTPVTITLPVQATGADVLDPETTVPHRANLEWGEPPKKLAEQVGAVQLAQDGRSLVFTPGTEPQGILWVQAETAISAADVTVKPIGDKTITRPPRFLAGPILVPPPGEMARMRALSGDTDIEADVLDQLRELGYVH